MADDWAIRVDSVSKKFGLSLRQSMHYGLRDSIKRLVGKRGNTSLLRPGEFWAVNDVSFELRRGESLGIMGVNGCGKTTLLRILNGVYRPDAGEARLRGRVGALIAAGAGFAPMLTGRENVFVNGALLGMTPTEIRARMDEIIAFAELEQFMDLPVKHYSSGMFVRLGFAIAAMSQPEVLLVDEVLAVGDLNFQKKCYDYLFQLKRQGTSIVLVSHSIGAIWAVCDRGLFMDRGVARLVGPVEEVIRAYDEQNARNAVKSSNAVTAAANSSSDPSGLATSPVETGQAPEMAAEYGHNRGGTGDAYISNVQVLDDAGQPRSEFEFGEPITLAADVTVLNTIDTPLLRWAIDAMHYRFICVLDSLEQGLELDRLDPGQYRLTVKIPAQNLRPGAYKLNCAVLARRVGIHLFYWFNAAQIQVRHPRDKFLYADDQAIVHLDAEFGLT